MSYRKDGRASNGGARPGAGRPPRIAEHCYAAQRATNNDRARRTLTDGELDISLGCLRAAVRDLEAEQQRRKTMYTDLLEQVKAGDLISSTYAGNNESGVSLEDIERHLGTKIHIVMHTPEERRAISMAQAHAAEEWAREKPDAFVRARVAQTREWNERIGGRTTHDDITMVALFAEYERRGL